MTLSLEERLNQILPRVTSRDFLDSKGLGNEIGFWIFDHSSDREMDVREFLSGTVVPALGKQSPAIRCAVVGFRAWAWATCRISFPMAAASPCRTFAHSP